MSRGIKVARAAFITVAVLMVSLAIIALLMGKTAPALSLIPVGAGFAGMVFAYREDTAKYHAPMSRGEILRAVLPLAGIGVLIVLVPIIAVLIDHI